MSQNVVFTIKDSQADSSITGFTIYGNQKTAEDASGNLILISAHGVSPTGMQDVLYPGHKNVHAKYMAGNISRWILRGYIFDSAGSEATLTTSLKSLLAKNKAQIAWTVTIGGVTISSSRGAVIHNITTDPLGDGSGPRWVFSIELENLGSD